MKRYQILLAAALSLVLLTGSALALSVEEAFPAQREYPGYEDVPAGSWFEAGAKLCYEVGFITGSNLGFEPERNMQVAEVAAIAARIAEAVTGDPIPQPEPSLPWYASYLEYLAKRGVARLTDPESPATRGRFLDMLAAVVPGELLPRINTITALPDTADAAVLRFYNAGILTGVDEFGAFDAAKPLTRAEGAAMVARIARTDLRKRFTPADYAPFAAAELRPGDILFQDGARQVTARYYLPAVLELIAQLERESAAAGLEFNWFNTYGEQTFLDYVKGAALGRFSVTREMATALYQSLDLQVFYSRYLDRKGAMT